MGRKWERIFQKGFVGAFALLIVSAAALTCRNRNKTDSFYENRLLAKPPEWSWEGILDGSSFAGLEEYLNDHAGGRMTFARQAARAEQWMGRPVVNEVVVQDDILLPYLKEEPADEKKIAAASKKIAENLASVDRLVTFCGGKFCYAAVPCQYAYFEDRYPPFLDNRSERTRLSIEYLRQDLAERGIGFLDVGAEFDRLGHPDRFSSYVDNHYSVFGAYVAYRAILDYFDDAAVPVLKEDAFTYEEVETPYLGSRMRKLIDTWPSSERLFAVTPQEPVPFTRYDNGVENLPWVYLYPGGDDPWVTYNFYMGGDNANTVIDTGRDELPSILIYGDSFTNAVECILYWSFNEMHSLDLRHTERSLGEYIETLQPDYVICIRDYESLLSCDANGKGIG